MPRQLPWLADSARRSTQPRSSPSPLHRPRNPPAEVNRNRDIRQRPVPVDTSPRHLDLLRSSRSPPTSPIEAPPTEEYIKEGLDKDDMYIMVEDEFYAVAQQFTRHLHHAEYVRRRKEAKRTNASAFKDMERPTDGSTIMSREMLHRKKSERNRERHERALVPTTRRPRTEEEEAEEAAAAMIEEEEEEEEREDDPWYGTSLHTLMTSPRKNRSLAGLQSIRSSTRAAAGFRSSELARTSGNPNRPAVSGMVRDEQQPANAPTATSPSSDDDDDDLEIIESKSSRPHLLPQSSVRVREHLIKRESPENDSNPILRHTAASRGQTHERNEHDRHSDQLVHKPPTIRQEPAHTANTIRSRKRILLDELDDFVTEDIKQKDVKSSNDIIQAQPRRSISTTVSRTTYRTPNQREEQKVAKKSRLNDIPTFLV